MAISVTGRVVKVKQKSEVQSTRKNSASQNALKYNHLMVHFTDGSDRHFLFTDKQINRGFELAQEKLKELYQITWIKEVWYEDLMELDKSDIEDAMIYNALPKLAKNYNHIRIDYNDLNFHLLFADRTIRDALERAKNMSQRLPKISWISDDILRKRNGNKKQKSKAKSTRKQA